eukprot:TRINITY_DN103649_c0_g1_i1.p1 TRINITY_DN103649_c0_g1~~TRINITY_DN103649_c0_g1_i1.p1  ORF type:complete len:399 (-),score=21.04 TRINITY_DN103649_c0_g1_i1:37-1119(-)
MDTQFRFSAEGQLPEINVAPIGLLMVSFVGRAMSCFLPPKTLDQCPKPKCSATHDGCCPTWNDEFKVSKMAANTYDRPDLIHTCFKQGTMRKMAGMSLTGVLWYQGESDVPLWPIYECRQRQLFSYLREISSTSDMPIILTLLAPWSEGCETVPYLRQTQLNMGQYQNMSVVTAHDVGLGGSIHPPDKRELGRRYALEMMRLLALDDPQISATMAQNIAATETSTAVMERLKPPEVDRCVVSTNTPATIACYFNEKIIKRATPSCVVTGWKSKLKQIQPRTKWCCEDTPFEVSGVNSTEPAVWLPAQNATVDGNVVKVVIPTAQTVTFVRFQWDDVPQCSLYSVANDVPVLPFLVEVASG